MLGFDKGAYRIQTKMPRFQLAQRGSVEALDFQRKHFKTSAVRHTLIPFAVSTALVGVKFHQTLERLSILFGAISGWIGPPGHC